MRAKARYVRWCSQYSSLKKYIHKYDRLQKFKGSYCVFGVPFFTGDGESCLTAQAAVLGLHVQHVSKLLTAYREIPPQKTWGLKVSD